MAALARNTRRAIGSVGHFFDGLVHTVHFAREAQRLAATPEATFRARGTTRDAELRSLLLHDR